MEHEIGGKGTYWPTSQGLHLAAGRTPTVASNHVPALGHGTMHRVLLSPSYLRTPHTPPWHACMITSGQVLSVDDVYGFCALTAGVIPFSRPRDRDKKGVRVRVRT